MERRCISMTTISRQLFDSKRMKYQKFDVIHNPSVLFRKSCLNIRLNELI